MSEENLIEEGNDIPAESSVFYLQDDGRLADPKAFQSFLSKMDGQPVTIDANKTPLITSLVLQVLIAGQEHWKANNLSFEVVNMTDQFKSSLALLGWQPNS